MRRLCSVMWLLLSLSLAALAPPLAAQAQIICISNVTPPPDIPVYEQPPIPAAGYLWIPGYWASGPNGYFWVPGTWVLPPAAGLFWTPGYWGWRDGIYVWNAGYWGPHVGFYGGINYGFGYIGIGYEGGRWENGVFAYNRAVNNLGAVAVARVYEKPVAAEASLTRVSFNGGAGGTTVRPTAEEEAVAHEQHVAALPAQFAHERGASSNKALLASENRGRPAIAATVRPGEFTGKGVVAAREVAPGATIPAIRPGAVEVSPHPMEPKPLPREERPGGKPAPLNAAIPPKPVTTEEKLPPRDIERKPPPTTAAVKPATPPVRPTVPVQAVAKPLPVPPRPAAPAGKPACPPGKALVEVNGHPTCK